MTHLTTDELELWLSGTLPTERSLHLNDCPACARVARQDALLVTAIGALPHFAPRAGFAEAVMRRVRLPDPAWYQAVVGTAARVTAGPRRWALAGGAGALAFASTAGLLLLAAANFTLLRFAAGRLITDGWTVAAGAIERLGGAALLWGQANPAVLGAIALGVSASYVVAFVGYRYLTFAGRPYATVRTR